MTDEHLIEKIATDAANSVGGYAHPGYATYDAALRAATAAFEARTKEVDTSPERVKNGDDFFNVTSTNERERTIDMMLTLDTMLAEGGNQREQCELILDALADHGFTPSPTPTDDEREARQALDILHRYSFGSNEIGRAQVAGLVEVVSDALRRSEVPEPSAEHPSHSGHEFGGGYARAAALEAGDPDWMNATGGEPQGEPEWQMCGALPAEGVVKEAGHWSRCIKTAGHTDDHMTDQDYCGKTGHWLQGEPSDTQVGAAMHAVERYYASQGITSVSESVDYQAMRAALRAAGGAR